MRTVFTCLVCLCLLLNANGQITLLNENFNAGLPTTWTQSPATTWSLNASVNTPGNCIVNGNITSNSTTAFISTPTLNVSSTTNFTITFKAAVTKNNFLAPEIVLSHSNASGTQSLALWSSGFNPNATYTLNEGFETQSDLGPEDVFWQTCTHTVSSVNGSVGNFIFTSMNVNGGWTLLDDVVISGIPTNTVATGLNEKVLPADVSVFPNPTLNGKVRLHGMDIQTIHLCDNLGKMLTVNPTYFAENAFELDLSHYQKGIYYLGVTTGNSAMIWKKIVFN